MDVQRIPTAALDVFAERLRRRGQAPGAPPEQQAAAADPGRDGWMVQDGIVQARVYGHAPDPALLPDSVITASAGIAVGQPLPWPRGQRSALLTACDWTQAPDARPPGGRDAWAAYRQVLRDLPTAQPDAAAMYAAGAWPTVPTSP